MRRCSKDETLDNNLRIKLFFEAVQRNDLNDVIDYLEKGFSIDTVDPRNGKTAIHYAAELGYEKMAQYLLNHNASVKIEDDYGDIALDLAIDNDQKAIERSILESEMLEKDIENKENSNSNHHEA